jgi:branched-chain amino acid transport system permease protein
MKLLGNVTENQRPLLWLLGTIVVLSFFPVFIKATYWLHISVIVGIYIILATGLNMLTGLTGLLSIGHAAFFGIGAYASALLAIKLNLSFWITLPIAGIFTGFAGLLLSLPCLRLKGVYLTITTIGFGQIIYTIFVEWREMTKGPMGLTGVPSPKIGNFVFGSQGVYFYLVLVFAALLVLIAWQIEHSVIGRGMKSVRDDEIAAEVSGVDSAFYKKFAFTFSAVYAGLAGSLYAHYFRFISPDSFGPDFSTMVLMMIIIGGLGSIPGSIIGAVIVAILPEALRDFKSYQMIIYGLMLVVCMIFLPKGLVSVFGNIYEKIKYKLNGTKMKSESTNINN